MALRAKRFDGILTISVRQSALAPYWDNRGQETPCHHDEQLRSLPHGGSFRKSNSISPHQPGPPNVLSENTWSQTSRALRVVGTTCRKRFIRQHQLKHRSASFNTTPPLDRRAPPISRAIPCQSFETTMHKLFSAQGPARCISPLPSREAASAQLRAIVIKQCFRAYTFPRRFIRVADQKIETDPAPTERNQYLVSHGNLPDGRPRASNLEGST